MSITKYYEINCDWCGLCIGHYTSTKGDAIENGKEDGMIMKKNQHFCDNICRDRYEEALKESEEYV